jgi:polyhydroxyalkanoate synthesis repressor PhaR
MTEQRIIKKYPNRRLYDTVDSKYITIDAVKDLVMSNANFSVIDKKSGEDITRNILLQIIIEQEDDDMPIFSVEVLAKIIRLYGDGVQDLASTFLDRSFSRFTEQQEQFNERMKETMRHNPLSTMTEVTQKNMQLWQKMQDDFFSMPGLKSRNSDSEE